MNCSFNRRQRSWLAAMVSGMTVITFVPAAVAHASETQLPEESSSSSAPSSSDHAMGSQIKKHEHETAVTNRVQSLTVDTEPEGMDVSSHDGNVDWPTKASSGMSFAWIKATEGTSYQNPFYASQYNGSQSAGLIGVPITLPCHRTRLGRPRRRISPIMAADGRGTATPCPGSWTWSTTRTARMPAMG